MKTEAGLLSLHLNSNDKPSAEATSSSLVSIFLSLVQKKKSKKKNHKSAQQNKHADACAKMHSFPSSLTGPRLALLPDDLALAPIGPFCGTCWSFPKPPSQPWR